MDRGGGGVYTNLSLCICLASLCLKVEWRQGKEKTIFFFITCDWTAASTFAFKRSFRVKMNVCSNQISPLMDVRRRKGSASNLCLFFILAGDASVREKRKEGEREVGLMSD